VRALNGVPKGRLSMGAGISAVPGGTPSVLVGSTQDSVLDQSHFCAFNDRAEASKISCEYEWFPWPPASPA
jgi:hypothetical protein